MVQWDSRRLGGRGVEVVDDRRERGLANERFIDGLLERHGWRAVWRNRRVKGGEIDRLYRSPRSGFCLAEIKSLRVKTEEDVAQAISAAGLQRVLNFRQLRQLFRQAVTLEAYMAQQSRFHDPIHVRLFVVLEFSDKQQEFAKRGRRMNDIGTLDLDDVSSFGRVMYQGTDRIVISIAPQFVPRGQRSGPFQVEV